MKINTVDTVIQDFREGQNIFRRPSVELMVREISRQAKRIEELEIHNKNLHLACVNALDLHRESDVPKLKDIPKIIEELRTRVQELEQERRWIPVREYPSQQGWYRVIINDGTEKVRFYKRDTENNREYWHVANNKEWIIMWFNPCLPQPPKEEE